MDETFQTHLFFIVNVLISYSHEQSCLSNFMVLGTLVRKQCSASSSLSYRMTSSFRPSVATATSLLEVMMPVIQVAYFQLRQSTKSVCTGTNLKRKFDCMIHEIICFSDYTLHLLLLLGFILQCCIIVGSGNTINIHCTKFLTTKFCHTLFI